MMFDPQTLGDSLKAGDKMSMTFHKGQPKGPSFMDTVPGAGGPASQPGQGAPPMAPAPPMGAPAGLGGGPAMASLAGGALGPGASMAPAGADPMADKQALMQALQARMGGGV